MSCKWPQASAGQKQPPPLPYITAALPPWQASLRWPCPLASLQPNGGNATGRGSFQSLGGHTPGFFALPRPGPPMDGQDRRSPPLYRSQQKEGLGMVGDALPVRLRLVDDQEQLELFGCR